MAAPINQHLNNLARKLASLHRPSHPLLLSNVWDAASTSQIAAHTSTKALATASYAIAATQGIQDNDMTLTANINGIQNVVAGLRNAGKERELPVSADLQDGYADPAETVRKVIELGVVGCNLEDVRNETGELRGWEDAVGRIVAVKKAAAEVGVPDFVVNARTDVLGFGGNIGDVVERGKKYLEAGATTVFVWGVFKWDITPQDVEVMVQAFGGRLAVQPGSIGVERLKQLGVSRISVGPALWRKSMSVVEEEAVRLKML